MSRKIINAIDTIPSSINYEGLVTIKYIKSNKTITKNYHNTGKDGLFTVITRALANYNIQDYIPNRIAVGNINSGEWESGLTQENIKCSDVIFYKFDWNKTYTQTSGEDNNTIQYTFSLPVNIIKAGSYNYIRLCNNRNDVCAEIELSDPIERSGNSSILIYWKLRFKDISTD